MNIEKIEKASRLIGAFLGCLFLISCAVSSETYRNPVQEATTNKSQYSKVTFYNDTNFALYPSSDTVGIEIVFDGKHAAYLRHDKYIELYLQKGPHELTLAHWDVFRFTDKYTIDFTLDEYVLQIYCQPISTIYEFKNMVPKGFLNASDKADGG